MANVLRSIGSPKSLADYFGYSRKAKSLLISSAVTTAGTYDKKIHDRIEKCKFQIQLQHGVPTIPSTISLAYPTFDILKEAINLSKRSGAVDCIIGLGCGPAIDLAKAVAQELTSSELLLIPVTPGAVMASASDITWVYDVNENSLLPLSSSLPDRKVVNEMIEHNPSSSMWMHAAYSVLALCVESNAMNHVAASHALAVLHGSDNPREELSLALLESGSMIKLPSPALSLACGLIPPYYPHVPILTFMASLFPGICKEYKPHLLESSTIKCGAPSLASLMTNTNPPGIDTMMQKINDTMTLWPLEEYNKKCMFSTEHRDSLERILLQSLNR